MRPPGDDQTAQTVRRQYRWLVARDNRVVECRDPFLDTYVVPVALLDTMVFGMATLPVALPMVGARAVPARDDQDPAHRVTASAVWEGFNCSPS